MSVRLRSSAPRCRRSSRACARRAPGLAPGAPETRRRRDHVQRPPGGHGRRGHVPSRLRDGPRRDCLETGDEPLQERAMPELGEDQEPGLRAAVTRESSLDRARSAAYDIAFFIALLSTGLALGGALAHLFELPNKIDLPRERAQSLVNHGCPACGLLDKPVAQE